ncbi:hypothetical protein KGG85_gp43 [Streptomyces phage Tefunt]|uniref:Uncharacterized protein n=2 Tax=Omarvirus TaxID=2948847 RepID=A0A291LHW9_9CAUD|nr:hypothetical protein KGG83_gp41 [Streptomyces phage Amethyst]YP_010055411.1 hypothetical protein KGG85_gp43 [Streptomyces phage Tefunt]AXH70247.1 hypothetical protein SEA_HAIZUM_43 [Streptomyces phage Haizum]QAY15784.1 hypothetical protein SEA_NISHIKIGOI_43 [Streptomyces phage Nishikigoi]ATI18663.1 hypothetical protein SEA_AMETHYST_41 [Streptomyces phage Amethyst]ATI18983.1 hypothetical protein SEA_TEFUNT_43 [Streptomyces phage Tefunt]
MNEDEFELPEGVEVTDVTQLVDHFSNVKRAASIVGDLRKALREEGFCKVETFELVQMYWASELGAFD